MPARRRGHERLDDPRAAGAEVVVRELRDVTRANALFGGTHAVVREVCDALSAPPRRAAVTLVDVGTGLGDIPRAAAAAVARLGIRLESCGVELSEAAARAAHGGMTAAVCADAFRLPFADGSVDLVTCSQLLHHFEGEQAVALLREMDRVAAHRVIVSDLRRSWIAAAGLWAASWPLGFHPHSRHDGVTSVLRGFRRAELQALAAGATGAAVRTVNRAGFRVTASWRPVAAGGPPA
ncbi:MAG: methyltransferase domain-containing protein [Gemmatimonadetes bacterium]|nr:methyltransferase domain-containing protein [Gemmatimonadota bacterium]